MSNYREYKVKDRICIKKSQVYKKHTSKNTVYFTWRTENFFFNKLKKIPIFNNKGIWCFKNIFQSLIKLA